MSAIKCAATEPTLFLLEAKVCTIPGYVGELSLSIRPTFSVSHCKRIFHFVLSIPCLPGLFPFVYGLIITSKMMKTGRKVVSQDSGIAVRKLVKETLFERNKYLGQRYNQAKVLSEVHPYGIWVANEV